MSESISCNVADTLGTQRALQGHSGTQGPWAVGHWRHSRHSGTRRALRHSNTQGTWALGHSGTLALRHSDTRALRQSRHFI